MYFVQMPPQEIFAPFFMRSKIASSPSRLMTVKVRKSIRSFRRFRSRLALLHAV
jgi:hypothetical protein